MRAFRKTIRLLARLVYGGLGIFLCLLLLLLLFSLASGYFPGLGVLAHGNVTLPSRNCLIIIFNGVVMIVACDLYFRGAGKYRNDENRPGE